MSTEEFFKVLSDEEGANSLNSLGFDGIYLIESGAKVKATADIRTDKTEVLADNFKRQEIRPKVIYDDNGREAFYIYRGVLK